MSEVVLSPETVTAINREFITSIKSAGLVLVSEADAQQLVILNQQRNRVMKRKHVSTRTIEKYSLIDGVETRQTVVNMIKDGRITADEWFKDMRGNYQVLTIAIRRLNDE